MSTTTIIHERIDWALLVEQARRGDGDAFIELIFRCERSILSTALRLTGCPDSAEDVRQETALKAYSHLAGFLDNARFPAWISRIAVNEAFTVLRKRHPGRWVSLEQLETPGVDGIPARQFRSPGASPEEEYAGTEFRRAVADALETLEPTLRSVCLLRDVQNLTTEETARHLGLSPAAVRTRLFRGRSKLRERLHALCVARPSRKDSRGSPSLMAAEPLCAD